MYETTKKFNDVICGDDRKFHIKIRAGEKESTDDAIQSLEYHAKNTSSDYIAVGGAFASYVNLELWNPGFSLKEKEFEIKFGLEVNDGIEWCSLGYFTADSIKTSINETISITAYDRVYTKFSGAFFSELTYPTDAINVLEEISKKTGVQINTSNLEKGILIDKKKVTTDHDINSDGDTVETVAYKKPFDGYTYKEALGYIAMLFCKFAVADPTGKVIFRWYQTVDKKITKDDFFTDFKNEELAFRVKKITCNNGEEEFTAGEGKKNVSLENPVMTQERLDYIYKQLSLLQFVPAHFSMWGDIRLELGDMPLLEALDGTIYSVPIMNITQSFDGGLKTNIQSYGGTSQENSTAGIVMKTLERQYTETLLLKNLIGQKAGFEYVEASLAKFKEIIANKITAEVADMKYAKIDFANIDEAAMAYFYAASGLIKNVKIGNATITGELVGVTIKGDLIEGNTVIADKLVMKGEDGLYYKLNTDGMKMEAEQTEHNSLNGDIITKKSITASKIDVEDLVAFGATIGGFGISENAIHSTGKETIDSAIEGLYMDKNGQVSIGDSNEYIVYRLDEKGNRHLEISLKSLTIGTSRKDVGEALEKVEETANKAIISSVEEFYHSDSPTELIGGEGWSVTEPSWKEGKYIWRRTKNTYGDGTEDYTPSENGVCITGNTGQDSILLYIDSSNGTVFKNNSVSTVLSVVIYYGSRRITDADEMKKTFGESAFLQWKWKMPEDEDYIEVARDDYRIKGDGFTLTLSPDDVTIRATFSCELNI